jgi:exosortase A
MAAGLLALFGLFHAEVTAALKVWNESTAFGHCYLVLPIAAWLAWERRAVLSGLAAQPMPWLGMLGAPLACMWLAADRLGFMEGRQFAVLGLIWLLFLALFGYRIGRALAVPLAYLVFLVPFGAFLVPALQNFTAHFIDWGLELLDVPHMVTAILVEIPEGDFLVAEACAGLRFLIAAIAFGALYACVIYRSPARRMAFIAVCVVAPVVANGVRALGIVLIGHIRGSAEAGAVDHILYGWLFFSMVIVLLLLLGLPFRQDSDPVTLRARLPGRPTPTRPRQAAAIVAAAAVLLPAAGGPAATAWLDQRARVQTAALVNAADRAAAQFVTPFGCTAEPGTASPGVRRFDCEGLVVTARVQLFSKQAGPAILAAWRDAVQWESTEDAETAWLEMPTGQGQMVSTHHPDRDVAVTLWVDGEPVRPNLRLRLRLALASVQPMPDAAAAVRLVLVSVVPAGPNRRALLAEFAAAQQGLAAPP